MIHLRPSASRGQAEHGWLESQHSFSFGSYYNPRELGFGALRVINEDRVVPGAGFAPHSHQDMEIISYVLDGGLRHRDSTGGGSVLRPGELQLMSAGHGITHSEMNASASEPVHFLQIWIEPAERGGTPGYQQQALDATALADGFTMVAGPAGEPVPFTLRQDARLYIAWPTAGQTLHQPLDGARRYYLHQARGSARANGQTLAAGDALTLQSETQLDYQADSDGEALLFELP